MPPTAKPEPEPARDEPADAPKPPADRPDDSGDEPAEDTIPADETTPAPHDDPPTGTPEIELPAVPPITVTTPPVVIEVPAPRPAAPPATDPAPATSTPVITVPIVGPVAQPAADPGVVSAPTSAAAATKPTAHVSIPAGLPVPIGPVLGRTLDDGIRPPEPAAEPTMKVSKCSKHKQTLEDVRQALIDMATEHKRRSEIRAADQVTRPCPGAPLGPDADVTSMVAVHCPGASNSDQALGDTPSALIWPTLGRLAALRARSTIPAGWSTHLDPRPA